jgi:hypothetical protein
MHNRFSDSTKQKVVASWSALWLVMKAESTAASRKRRGQAGNGAIPALHNQQKFPPHRICEKSDADASLG